MTYDPAPGDLRRTAASGAVVLGLGSVFQAALQLLVVAILARLLSPMDFGQVAAALIVADLANQLAQMGVGQGLVRRRTLDEAYIRTTFTLSVGLGLMVAAVMALLSTPIASALGAPEAAPMLIAIAAGVVLASASTTSQFLLVRRMDSRAIALRRLAGYVVGYGLVGIGGALLGLGAWSLVLAYLADVASQFVLGWLKVRHSLRPLFAPTLAKDILGFGGAVALGRMVNAVIAQTDRVLVANLFGPTALGLYTRAYQLMRFPGQVLGNIIDDIALPGFSRLQGSHHEVRRGVATAVGLCGLLLAPTAAVLFLMAEDLVIVLLGPDWAAAAPILAVLSLGLPFRPLQRIMVAKMLAEHRPWLSAMSQCISLAVLAVSVAAGAFHWGLIGAAAGLAAALFAQALILTVTCVGRDAALWAAISMAFVRAAPLTAAVVAAGLSVRALGDALSWPPVLVLPIGLIAITACAGVCILLYPDLFLGHDGRSLVRLILPRLVGVGRSRSLAGRLLARLG